MSVNSVEYSQYVDSQGVLHERYMSHVHSYNTDIQAIYNVKPGAINMSIQENLLKDFKKQLKTYKKCEQWLHGYNQHMCNNNGGHSVYDALCIWCKAQTSAEELTKIIESLLVVKNVNINTDVNTTNVNTIISNTTSYDTQPPVKRMKMDMKVDTGDSIQAQHSTNQNGTTSNSHNNSQNQTLNSPNNMSNPNHAQSNQTVNTNNNNTSNPLFAELYHSEKDKYTSLLSEYQDVCSKNNILQQKYNILDNTCQSEKLALLDIQDKYTRLQHTQHTLEQQQGTSARKELDFARKEQELVQKVILLEQKMDEERKVGLHMKNQVLKLENDVNTYKQQIQEFQAINNNNNNNTTDFTPASHRLGKSGAPGTMKKFQRPTLDNASNTNTTIKNNNMYGNAPASVKAALDHNATGNTGKKTSLITEKYHELLNMTDGQTLPEGLDGCDPALLDSILHDMLDQTPGVTWEDIAGLEFAKKNVFEVVIWPMIHPELFQGLRDPLKGMQLFGPPGTGKTQIGKAIASQSSATFFSISASSLTSKWHGEGEKLVRTLFSLARYLEPSVIFIDEVDSLQSQRQSSEFEANRRMKTEFLIQLDGAASGSTVLTKNNERRTPRVLIVGATNRPQEIDEAARRRMTKKLYVPLPNAQGRHSLISRLLRNEKHSLDETQLQDITTKTHGYSGADQKSLCTEAAYGPLRNVDNFHTLTKDTVRPISYQDFIQALALARPSVDEKDLKIQEDWNKTFGSFKIEAID